MIWSVSTFSARSGAAVAVRVVKGCIQSGPFALSSNHSVHFILFEPGKVEFADGDDDGTQA
jgi:hypothetical protein